VRKKRIEKRQTPPPCRGGVTRIFNVRKKINSRSPISGKEGNAVFFGGERGGQSRFEKKHHLLNPPEEVGVVGRGTRRGFTQGLQQEKFVF